MNATVAGLYPKLFAGSIRGIGDYFQSSNLV